ncbi:MAG: choice-of-anchor D domain-containing protein, partial [Deltaproteobacteria bacterium]|nr:choice-of-anchor D domain-containing protein [Kofleriaceae bacterium]
MSISGAAATDTVTITNAGTTTEVSGFSMGAGCGEFTASATFGGMPVSGANPAILANTETLVINVSYDPVDRTGDTCSVTILDNEPGADETFDMTGDGIAPVLALSPASLSFADQDWDAGTGEMLLLTLTNNGDEPIAMSNITTSLQVGTHFSLGAISGLPIAGGGGTGTLAVTFNPTSNGVKNDQIRITLNNDAPSEPNPHTYNISGEGIEATQTFSAATLNVGTVAVGSSVTNTMTIGNSGKLGLTISSMTITGTHASEFAFTDHMCTGTTCNPDPDMIAANGGSSGFVIRCAPLDRGLRTATLTVNSNDPASPKTATLECTGQSGEIAVSPTSINFGLVRIGNAPTQMITITNAAAAGATAPLTIDVSEAIADVSITCNPGCSTTIPINGMATVTVTFAPTAALMRSGNVQIMANDPNEGTTNVSVMGTGGESDLVVSSPFNFGNVPVSQVGGSVQNLTITNAGNMSLNTTTMTITGSTEFSFAFGTAPCTSGQSCTRTVTAAAGNGTASIPLRCDPTTSGPKTATLLIESDDPSPPGGQTVTLNCTGTVPTMTTAPSSLTFGNQRINTSSGAMTFQISNAAGASVAPLDYSVTRPAAHFLMSIGATQCNPTCTGTLAAGASATVSVVFRPTTPGPKSDMITVTGNDPANAMDTVAVSGTGVQPLIVLDAPTPATPPTTGGALAFGNVTNNTTSTGQTITVRNNGTMDLMISNVINTNPGDFNITAPATATLGPTETQSWTVTCDPETQGPKTGTIQIINNSENDTSVDIALSCTSIEGRLVVTASPVAVSGGTINFGPVRLNTMRTTTVTLTNQGNVPVTVAAVNLGSMTEGFSVTGFTAGTMVAANNGTTTFTVVFAPTLEAHGTTTLTVDSNWNDPVVNLTGDGQLADMVMNPNPANLGDVNWDGTATQIMTVQNLGTATINVMSATMLTGAGEFTITGFTAGNLAGMTNRTFSLNAVPTDTMLGLRQGTLRLTTDLPAGMGQTIDVPVSYTSVGPAVSLSPGMVVDFGGVDVDAGPATMQLQLTNSGSGRMDITSVGALTGVFSRTNFPDLTLDPAQAGSITISYDPTTERDPSNPETQTFTIATDGLFAGGAAQPPNIQVTVRGFGTDRHILVPDVVFPPTYRNPTDAQVPTSTCGVAMDEPCAVRVCNTGGALLDVTMIDDPDDAFELMSTAALQVGGGSAASPTCMEVPVAFRPTAYGQFTGTVTLMNNDNGNAMAVVQMSGDGIERPVGVTPNLVPAATIAQGAPVRLTDLVAEGLVLVNMSSAEPFSAEVTAVPNTGNVTATLVGDDGTLAASQTRTLDVELIGTAPGTVDVVVEVHLDGDPDAHASFTIPLEIVRVDVEGGGCDSGGGGAAGGAAAALLLLLLGGAMRPSTRARVRSRSLRTNGIVMILLVVPLGVRADVSRNIDLGSAPTTTATEPGLFDVDTPDIAGKGAWALSFTGQYESNPMVARWTDSAMVEHELALIEQRNAFVFGFGYAITDKLELSARLPMYQQTGQARMMGDPFGVEGADGFSLGDVAVRAKAQLVKGTVGFAGALDVTAPTAKDGQFAGTDLPTAHVQGLLGVRSGRRVTLAVNGGFLARQATQFLLLEQGSELTYGAALGLRVLDKVAIVGEASGALGVVGAEGKVS